MSGDPTKHPTRFYTLGHLFQYEIVLRHPTNYPATTTEQRRDPYTTRQQQHAPNAPPMPLHHATTIPYPPSIPKSRKLPTYQTIPTTQSTTQHSLQTTKQSTTRRRGPTTRSPPYYPLPLVTTNSPITKTPIQHNEPRDHDPTK